jgi:hypothetical protein
MQPFKTAGPQGELTWELALNYTTLKRVKDRLHVDLADPLSGDPPLFTRLNTDFELLCNVIYVLCQPQAEVRKLSDEQFGVLLGPDAIALANEALFSEWRDFFLKLRRPETAALLEKQKTFAHKISQKGKREIESQELELVMDEALHAVSIDYSSLRAKLGLAPKAAPSAISG